MIASERVDRRAASGEAGISIVEVLAVVLVVGIAVVGVALMFGKGSAWVSATGADRVAAGLAQQRIERFRAEGWSSATAPGTIGAPLLEPPIVAANGHVFLRTACIQYVGADPTSPAGLAAPAFDPACPAGPETATVRMTVVITSTQPETSPVTLQAWLTQAGR